MTDAWPKVDDQLSARDNRLAGTRPGSIACRVGATNALAQPITKMAPKIALTPRPPRNVPIASPAMASP